jgi:sulfopyruvate decarboxylase TPP-binding subunit
MIKPKFFIDKLRSLNINFFAGVPDSLLKNMCAYISDNIDSDHNIIAANEGGAIGIAVGYHLATGKIGCVYMQNSGEGNIINPLASLTDKEVYSIPVLRAYWCRVRIVETIFRHSGGCIAGRRCVSAASGGGSLRTACLRAGRGHRTGAV